MTFDHYGMIGTEDITRDIEVRTLRKFQLNHCSPSKEFKPVPVEYGQDIARSREDFLKGVVV